MMVKKIVFQTKILYIKNHKSQNDEPVRQRKQINKR